MVRRFFRLCAMCRPHALSQPGTISRPIVTALSTTRMPEDRGAAPMRDYLGVENLTI
jgi:hypothetical protein